MNGLKPYNRIIMGIDFELMFLDDFWETTHRAMNIAWNNERSYGTGIIRQRCYRAIQSDSIMNDLSKSLERKNVKIIVNANKMNSLPLCIHQLKTADENFGGSI